MYMFIRAQQKKLFCFIGISVFLKLQTWLIGTYRDAEYASDANAEWREKRPRPRFFL